MSLRAIPLLAIALIMYNIIVLFGGGGAGEVVQPDGTVDAGSVTGTVGALGNAIFSTTLLSGGQWTFTWGDLILVVTLFLLFAEIVKSTFTSTSTLVDHGLSMLVFIAILVEFLIVPQAATSVFFLLLVASLIDVVAGYTIGIRVARRDLAIGGGDAL
jgi:hypothetical protein